MLAVADLHLGYAWSHRANGQLLPVTPRDETLIRLKSLLADYQPKSLVAVGDIVHCAVPAPALLEDLRGLLALADGKTELVLLAGNHDRALERLLGMVGAPQVLLREHRVGDCLFLHGDQAPSQAADRCVIGHEHPAISLGDGVATSRKFPCFLVSKSVIALPSFSNWSAHSPVYGNGSDFMSPIARAARFETALAIMGDRLLATPLR